MLTDGTFRQREIDFYFQKISINPVYGWLDIVITALLPFSIVESKTLRENVKHDPISLSTFMLYLPRLTESVERKLTKRLPNRIELIFDGWTSGSSHYVAFLHLFLHVILKVSRLGFSLFHQWVMRVGSMLRSISIF